MSEHPEDWGHPDIGQMTHAELVRELRRLRVLVDEMRRKLAGSDDDPRANPRSPMHIPWAGG